MIEADHALDAARRAVIGWGLPSEHTTTTDPIELDDAAAHSLLQWASVNRLGGLLWAAIADQAILVSSDRAQSARDMHLAEVRSALVLDELAADVVDRLQHLGIESRVLKGVATAHLDYPDPSLRMCSDLDLLVRRSDFPVAIAQLVSMGMDRGQPALAPWWERRYARAAMLRSPNGPEVDLHATIAVGYFGNRIEQVGLLDLAPDNIELGGSRVAALPQTARLLATCYAIALSRGHGVRLLRDLAQQLLVTGCSWESAIQLAQEGDGEAVMNAALHRAAEVFPQLAHTEQEEPAYVSRNASRALVLAEHATTHGWAADARSSLIDLGPIDRARFLLGAAIGPSTVSGGDPIASFWQRTKRFSRLSTRPPR